MLVFAFVASTAAMAERRIALVIGNDRYDHLAPLSKAVADAKAYAAVLRGKGFDDVILRTDLTRGQMDAAIAEFTEKIQPGDVAVFAYSGHGWSDGAENYLIGTEAPEQGSQEYLARISIPLRNGRNGVIDDMHRRGASLKVAIIDACRDNPFEKQGGTRSIGLERGLTDIVPPDGTFIVFAAGAGQVSLDRLSDADSDPNSVFTRAFVPYLQSETSLLDAVKAAQQGVMEMARLANIAQTPAYFDAVVGTACLTGTCETDAGTAVASKPADNREQLFWESIASSGDRADFEAYLVMFPDGLFAPLARNRVATLPAAPPPQEAIPEPEPVQPPAPAEVVSAEEQVWTGIAGSLDPVTLQAFLRLYPSSSHRAEVEARLAALAPQEPATVAPAERTVTDSPDVSGSGDRRSRIRYYEEVDFDGDDIPPWHYNFTQSACEDACLDRTNCRAFTFNITKGVCILKSGYGRPVAHLDAISGWIYDPATSPPPVSALATLDVSRGVDLQGGNDFADHRPVTLNDCYNYCARDDGCAAFSYVISKQWCWLKRQVPAGRSNADVVSGAKY